MVNMEDKLDFCKLSKKFESITKLSFHRKTLPHTIAHHTDTSGVHYS